VVDWAEALGHVKNYIGQFADPFIRCTFACPKRAVIYLTKCEPVSREDASDIVVREASRADGEVISGGCPNGIEPSSCCRRDSLWKWNTIDSAPIRSSHRVP
jgi:hypothetical protein